MLAFEPNHCELFHYTFNFPIRIVLNGANDILGAIRDDCDRKKQPWTIALHLPIQNGSIIDPCLQWNIMHDRKAVNNCNTNMNVFVNTLLTSGIVAGSAVYIAGTVSKHQVLNSSILRTLGQTYRLVFKEDILKRTLKRLLSHRETLIALDYYVCKNVDILIGHSVNTFSALSLLSRERSRVLGVSNNTKVNIHYNSGGKIRT